MAQPQPGTPTIYWDINLDGFQTIGGPQNGLCTAWPRKYTQAFKDVLVVTDVDTKYPQMVLCEVQHALTVAQVLPDHCFMEFACTCLHSDHQGHNFEGSIQDCVIYRALRKHAPCPTILRGMLIPKGLITLSLARSSPLMSTVKKAHMEDDVVGLGLCA